MTQDIVEIDDMTQVKLIGVYLVQKLGQPTLGEIIAVARDKCSVELNEDLLKRALSAAQKRDFLSINMAPQADGSTATVYSMKKLAWKAPPEFAHVKDLLPALLQTAAAKSIKAWFDNQEDTEDGDEDGNEDETKTTKKTRGNLIADYHAFEVRAVTLDPLLGAQLPGAYWESIRQAFPSALTKPRKDAPRGVEVDGVWGRDQLTGAYVIAPDALHGWFAANATRFCNLPDARAQHIAFEPLFIFPKKPVIQLVLPVVSAQQQGAKPKSHETLQPGEELVFRFSAPMKGFLTVEQLEMVFIISGLRPKRGISPCRGRRWGRYLVQSFTDLGPITKLGLDYLKESIPLPFRNAKGQAAYFYGAVERLKDVNLQGTFAASGAKPKGPLVTAAGGDAE